MHGCRAEDDDICAVLLNGFLGLFEQLVEDHFLLACQQLRKDLGGS